LRLWRNTVQLFYEYRSFAFVGPFKQAGFSDYKISPLLLTPEAGERTPDIVASSVSGWLAVELTSRGVPKTRQLESYTGIDPRYLSNIGLTVHQSAPDVVSSRLTFVEDGPFCQILVDEKLVVQKSNLVKNGALRQSLESCKGTDLTKLPSVPFTLLPESMTAQEVREGIVDIVLQLFEPNSSGKTPLQIVEQGLERLADKIGQKDLHTLVERVKEQIGILMKDFLPGYLEFSDEKYRPALKWKQHHKTKDFIGARLRDWISASLTSTKVTDEWREYPTGPTGRNPSR
jgi:hypothetical protein